MQVRLVTSAKRVKPLSAFELVSSVQTVACDSFGIAKEPSFIVSIFKRTNNNESAEVKAILRYRRCTSSSCSGYVASSSTVHSMSVDTGKNAGTSYSYYEIEALDESNKIIATLRIDSVKDGAQGGVGPAGPMLIPNGIWNGNTTYRSTNEYRIFTERNGQYYVLIKINADCKGVDPANDTKNEWWRLMDYLEYVFINAMVANFGKIGSAVFWGDYMFSQQGVDSSGAPSSDFKKFTTDMSQFVPNILINALTGYAHFGHGNIKMSEDGRMTFFSESTGGSIVVNPTNRTLQFLNSSSKAVVELGFNAERDGVNTESYIKLLNKTKGELKLYSDGYVTGESESGEVFSISPEYGLTFRDGLRYTPHGIVLNVYRAEDWSETNLLSARPDMVVFKANVTNMMLPTANAANRGRRIRMKNLQANVDFKSSTNNLYASNSMTPTNSVHVDAASTYEWWCDGNNWYMSFCK